MSIFSPTPSYEPPGRLWRNAHVQTVAAEWIGRRQARIEPTAEDLLHHADGTASRIIRYEPNGIPRGAVMVVHGLAGSADSPTTMRFAMEGQARAWRIVSVDLRGAGGTRSMPRIYTAADVDELDAAARHPFIADCPGPRVALGLSLGGGVVMRWLGLRGESAPVDCAVVAAPAAHLPSCAQALARSRHTLYDFHFAVKLGRRVRAVAAGSGRRPHAFWRHRSVRRLDDDFAASINGHPHAAAYYEASSAHHHGKSIARPTLVFASDDDPFVPIGPLVAHFGSLPAVEIRRSKHGGHLAFMGRRAGRLASLLPGLVFDALDGLGRGATLRP